MLDQHESYIDNPGSKVHEANMGPIWVREDPSGLHVGPMTFATWEVIKTSCPYAQGVIWFSENRTKLFYFTG